MTQKLLPEIKVPPPGPKAQAIIDLDKKYSSPSYIKEYPLVVERGEGPWVYDVDGNRFLDGAGSRARTGSTGAGPQVVITDYGVLRPDPGSEELQLASRFEGVTVDAARDATGWPLKVAAAVDVVAPPTDDELRVLRDLHERTRRAHSRPVPLPV